MLTLFKKIGQPVPNARLAHGNQEVACPNICPYAGEQTNFLSFCIFYECFTSLMLNHKTSFHFLMNNQDLKSATLDVLRATSSSPFLFVGSGFSRRYFNLPQWDELLKIFCKSEDEFDGLMAASSQNLPQVATTLAEKYHERWWNDSDFSDKREQFKALAKGKKLKNKTSALRWEICRYINEISKMKCCSKMKLRHWRKLILMELLQLTGMNFWSQFFQSMKFLLVKKTCYSQILKR